MARIGFGSVFNKFFSLFLLILLHLGCFAFAATDSPQKPSKKRKLASSPSRFKPHKSLSSSWSYIKSVFTRKTLKHEPSPATPALTSARSSHRSLVALVPTEPQEPELHPATVQESDITSDSTFLPLRNDIFPCTVCGEIFHKPQLLEQHLAVKHAVSELIGDDSGRNIVKIIFKTGWTSKDRSPRIDRILKIHNNQKVLSRFEEYRELVKSKAAARSIGGGGGRRRDERCIADGNELLRFHCSTFMCELGQDCNSTLCNQQFCSICGIIRSGFSPKLDGISTLSTSWRAHVAIPDETLEEFQFMNVKRAMLVCRVIAGRVGADGDEVDKEGGGLDSVVVRGGSGALTRVDEEELLVFSPRAVLPCFVIVYTV